MESVNNKTFTALQAGRAYIGTYDKVDGYSSAVLSIISDQQCLITVYQSQNRTLEYATQYTYTTTGIQFTTTISLTAPYVYFVVRNEGGDAQTYLSFTVIYKTAYPTVGGGVGSNVNIFDSTGAEILADSSNLRVKLQAVDGTLIQSGGLKTYVVNPFTPAVQRTTVESWTNQSINTGDTSSLLDVRAISSTNLSVYGTSSDAGTIGVQFSDDGTTFYSTQYLTSTVNGDFGFSCPMSAPYARLLWTGDSTTITAFIAAS